MKGKRAVSAWLRDVARAEDRGVGELAVVFTLDEYLLEVNRKYLGHDYMTDIITFDYGEGLEAISGDLLISIDTVRENAAKFGVSAAHELLRVMVHGVLHLCGYKDATEQEQQEMRAKEDFYIEQYNLLNG